MLKNGVFFVSICYTAALLIVCLITLNNLPIIRMSHGDKIFHFIAYFILTFLWVYTFILKFGMSYNKAVVVAVTGAVLYGILIEVLQGGLTKSRTFDYYDALANSLGAILVSTILLLKKIQVKKI